MPDRAPLPETLDERALEAAKDAIDTVLEWRDTSMNVCCAEHESCDVCPYRINWPEEDYDEIARAAITTYLEATARPESDLRDGDPA